MLGREFLEEAGFKLDTAGSATEAMNKLALVSGGFDAIIVDIGLPDRAEDAWREIRSFYSLLPSQIFTQRNT
jgi:DNA-binding response OmpR family regulator